MMSLLALEVAFSIVLIGFAWASRIGWAHPLIRHCLQSVAEEKSLPGPAIRSLEVQDLASHAASLDVGTLTCCRLTASLEAQILSSCRAHGVGPMASLGFRGLTCCKATASLEVRKLCRLVVFIAGRHCMPTDKFGAV